MSDILVIGGHGKVALRLAPVLAAQGDTVTAVIRNPEHAADIETAGATCVEVMADPETWAMACSAVIGPRVSRSPVAAWSAAAERSLRLWAMIADRGSRDEKMQRVKMCLSLRISVSN